MKPYLNCRQATILVLQGEDRPLSLSERIALRFHMLICKACPRFVRQVALMRGAVGAWKHYVDDDRP